MKKQVVSLIAAISLIITSASPVMAHSGRTDSSGGHKDNKNKSGLGYYHYHCGGYPAHLHENGVCPYKNSTSSNSNSSTSTTSYKNENTYSFEPKAEWIGDKYWTGYSFAEGWMKINGKTYYFDAYGDKITGWTNDEDDNTYYFDTNGVLATGWKKIDGNTYFFSAEGYMRTGWRKIEGKTYYFDKAGIMKTGKVKINSKTYYFNSDGSMKKGWVQIGDNTYYFRNKDDAMAIGKLKISGQVYEFDETGKLIED